MSKFKKDGVTPKLSGGSRGGGRPVKNAVPRKYVNLYLDEDLHENFAKLSADEKNKIVRSGMVLKGLSIS